MGVTGDKRRVLKQWDKLSRAHERLQAESDPARQRELALALRDRLARMLARIAEKPHLTALLRENDQGAAELVAGIAIVRTSLAEILGEDAA